MNRGQPSLGRDQFAEMETGFANLVKGVSVSVSPVSLAMTGLLVAKSRRRRRKLLTLVYFADKSRTIVNMNESYRPTK